MRAGERKTLHATADNSRIPHTELGVITGTGIGWLGQRWTKQC